MKRYRMARVNGITQFLPAIHTTILTLRCKHSPDGTTRARQYTTTHLILLTAQYIDLGRIERLSWPICLTCSGRFTRQLQVEHGTMKVRWSKTNVLTTVQRSQQSSVTGNSSCQVIAQTSDCHK